MKKVGDINVGEDNGISPVVSNLGCYNYSSLGLSEIISFSLVPQKCYLKNTVSSINKYAHNKTKAFGGAFF